MIGSNRVLPYSSSIKQTFKKTNIVNGLAFSGDLGLLSNEIPWQFRVPSFNQSLYSKLLIDSTLMLRQYLPHEITGKHSVTKDDHHSHRMVGLLVFD
jgi:hypothetical protein